MNADGPLVVTAVFRPSPGQRESVLAALNKAIPRVHQEAGCNLYAIQEASDGTIVMIEHWSSAELLDAHGQGEAVRDLNADLDGILSSPVEVVRLTPLPVGDARKGSVLPPA